MAERPPEGYSIRLTMPRKLVCDLLHFARRVPTVPVQRVMQLDTVDALRRASQPRVSWCAIFVKAYALVAEEMPELRRSYLYSPVPRLYQHPDSVASVAVERITDGEAGVYFGQLRQPERTSLVELDAAIKRYQTLPVNEAFRFVTLLYRLPRFLRRAAWWFALNFSGYDKAKFLGTFGVTVYSGLGAESLHPLSPLTTTLNYGIVDATGRVPVRIIYDHRAMDGSTVARAMVRLEAVLRNEICVELANGLQNRRAA